MLWVLGGLIGLVLVVLGFLLIPPSRVQRRFAALEQSFISRLGSSEDVFTLEDIAHLPPVVQAFYTNGGYIGKPKMTGLKASFSKVSFSLGQNKPTIPIIYTQLNGVKTIERYAHIDARMYGLPFEGLDSFSAGIGSMEGYLAKQLRLFNQTGDYMDKACLVTYLAEAFFLPTVGLSDAISYEQLDAYTVRATIRAFDMEASGVFTFSENGQMLAFTTNDRMAASLDGKLEQIPWTAECSDYTKQDGIWVPSRLKATWHYPQGDLVYFDGTEVQVTYYY
ncbi:DUF6544 family protein [Sphaerochaeta sp.]|uniref:DUF6544 family protein n=1 Tax=Sphaerochaeta sp. TaxID=1972642 RepID=UPI002FCAC897